MITSLTNPPSGIYSGMNPISFYWWIRSSGPILGMKPLVWISGGWTLSSLTKYVDGKGVTQFYAPLWRVFGSSPNNVFAAGLNNMFYHYNGIDWAQVYPIDEEVNGGIWALWCYYNYVFAVQHTANFTRILRGKNILSERK